MNTKYIGLLGILLGFAACDANDTDDITNEGPKVELVKGSADFTKYVAIGASFTAGYTDGALFKAGQGNSFPNILSQKFEMIGGGAFTQPLMNDNTGGFLFGGNPNPKFQPRLYFNGAGPVRLAAVPTTEAFTTLSGAFNNVGVPGAKSFHLIYDGYGNPANLLTNPATANPYFVRMATGASTTMLGDAVSQNPTFFTLSEIGGNDVLGYATSGGDGSDAITDTQTFNFAYTKIINDLTAGGAKGVVATVPYITSLPFFTAVPNNTLELDAAKSASLTGFFQAVAGIAVGVFQQAPFSLTAPQAQALASQYAITFAEGKNRWIIDVPVSGTNPLGFRQMTESELLLLTIDRTALTQGYGSVVLTNDVLAVLGLLQQGGTPNAQQVGTVLGAVSGLDDKDVLDDTELLALKTATDSYNNTIETIATSKGLAVVDFKKILEEASTTGISFDGYTMNTNLVFGGLIGLDGIHLTARGYALMANKFLEEIDATYGSNFIEAGVLTKAVDYPTNYSPLLP